MSPKYGYDDRREAARQAVANARAGAASVPTALPNRSGGMQMPSNKILPLHFQETTAPVQSAQVGIDPYYVDVFYSNPHLSETVSVDGWAERGGVSEAWSTIRAGAGTFKDDDDNTLIVHVISHGASGWQGIRRIFMLFYLGFKIDADAEIVSANLTMGPSTITQDFGGKIVVCEVAPVSNVAIAATDYSLVSDTALSNYVNLSDLTSGKPVRFTLNAAGRDVVAAQFADDGVAKLGIRLDWDLDDNEPTWVASKTDLVSFGSAETASKPEFKVVWSLGE